MPMLCFEIPVTYYDARGASVLSLCPAIFRGNPPFFDLTPVQQVLKSA